MRFPPSYCGWLPEAGASPEGAGVVPESAGAAGSAAGAGAAGSAAGAAGASDVVPGALGSVESPPLSHPARPNKPANTAVKTIDRVVLNFMT
ncbi:hypothetical protein ACVFVO_13085 [Advenella kashmirensis]